MQIARTSCPVLVVTAAFVILTGFVSPGTRDRGPQAQESGWQLPPDAGEKKNPHPVDDKLLATGRAIFKDKCARCHGPGGLGDGPDSDPDARDRMDMTNPERAEGNSDGVVFYKVWNGRRGPKMPAFSAEISEDQAWAVVAYVQSLRKQ
jgi:mono/diheme cytochrome c family protein